MATSKRMRKTVPVEATILFADMVDSSMLSHIYEPKRYDTIVATFQRTAASVVTDMLGDFSEVNSHLEASLRGDELSLILGCPCPQVLPKDWGKRLQRCTSLALQVAIRLKRRWLLIDENKRRIDNGQPPLSVAIGLHAGPLVIGQHARFPSGPIRRSCVTQDALTAEGYAINIAKRVETVSRSGRFSRIFLTRPIYNRTPADFWPAFVRVNVQELKGVPLLPAIYEAKGIGHFDDKSFPKCHEFENQSNLDLYEHVVSTNPDEVWLLLDLAHRYFDDGKYDLAAAKYRAVVEVDPTFAPAYAYLGRAYFRNYYPQEAKAAIERSLELDPSQARANHYLGVCLRREALFALYRGELGHAQELFKQSLESHNRACRIAELEAMDFPWAQNGLIWTAAQSSECEHMVPPFDLKHALQQVKKLQKEIACHPDWKPKEHLTLHTMALIELLMGQFTEAHGHLKDARRALLKRAKEQKVSLDDKGRAEKEAEILHHMARCSLSETDHLQSAKRYWQQARDVISEVWLNENDRKRALDSQYWTRFRIMRYTGEDGPVADLLS